MSFEDALKKVMTQQPWQAATSSEFPFWLWGYAVDASGKPIAYPHIKILAPDGTEIAGQTEYIGDGGGVFNLALRGPDWLVSITDNAGSKPYIIDAGSIVGQHWDITQVSPISKSSGSASGGNTMLYVVGGAAVLFLVGKKMKWF